jgi:hypothetical protein
MQRDFTSVDDIVKLILTTVDKNSSTGIMGHALLEFATRTTDVVTDVDQILFAQMRELRQAEEKGDLFWIDYGSWNAVGTLLREFTTEAIKPLFWNGVFTTFTTFKQFEVQILSRIQPGVIANLIRCGKNYQLFCVDHQNNNYTFMKTHEFDALAQRVKANLIKSYVRENNQLRVKNFVHDAQKNGANDVNSKDHPTPAPL